MFRVNGEFGIGEENNGLFDRVQSSEGSTVGSGGTFHLNETLRIDVDAEENVFRGK